MCNKILWELFKENLKLQRWPVYDPGELAEIARQKRIDKLTGRKKTPL